MLSEDRQAHWVSLITTALAQKGLLTYTNREAAIRAAFRGMKQFIQQHQQIEQKVRHKIHSLKREVPENSREWEVLYKGYYEEELSRSHLT